MLGEAGKDASPQVSSDDETKPMLSKSPSVGDFYIGDHPADSYSDAPSDDYLGSNEAKMQFHDPLARVRNVFLIASKRIWHLQMEKHVKFRASK